MKADIFVLNQCYYIPLWHEDITFGNNLQVKCKPNIPDYMHIDMIGDLHVNITMSFEKILKEKQVSVTVGEKIYEIKGEHIKAVSYQTIVYYGEGIPRIDHKDIYNSKNRGNVIMHINLV